MDQSGAKGALHRLARRLRKERGPSREARQTRGWIEEILTWEEAAKDAPSRSSGGRSSSTGGVGRWRGSSPAPSRGRVVGRRGWVLEEHEELARDLVKKMDLRVEMPA